jgi:hypothetical protein
MTKSEINLLRIEIWQWVKESGLEGKILYSVPLNKLVHFSHKGLKHAISVHHGYPEIELELVRQLPRILVDAYYVGFSPNKDGNPLIIGVHDFYNIVIHENKIYQIWLKVKETRDKTFYYDHGVISELK